MALSMDVIKKLRDKTGISVMQCKKALEEAGGDIEKAMVLLRKQSSAAAEKKADRQLGAGAVASYIHASGDIGSMVLLSSETDFVSKNPEFVALANDIALHAAAMCPQFISRDQVSESDLVKVKEVFGDEVKDKPKEMQEKIMQGKIDAYLKERVLLEQEYVKDPSKTIQGLLEEAVQKFGERIVVSECVRFSARD